MGDDSRRPKSKSRFAALAVIGILLLMLAVIVAWRLTHPAHPLDRAHYRRLSLGMTEAEVQAILGGPAGGSLGRNVGYALIDQEGLDGGATPVGGKQLMWASDMGSIEATFDGDGRLRWKGYAVQGSSWERLGW